MLREGVERNVYAPLFEIARNILPEIRQLQRGAGVIRKLLPLSITITAEIENQSAHWVGRIDAVIEDGVPRGVALHPLVLAKRSQQIAERLLRNILRANRLA